MRPGGNICHAVSNSVLITEPQIKWLRFTHTVNIEQKQDFKTEQLQPDSELLSTLQYHPQERMKTKSTEAPILLQHHSAFVWVTHYLMASWVQKVILHVPNSSSSSNIPCFSWPGVYWWWIWAGHYRRGNFILYFMIGTFGTWEEWAICSLALVELNVRDLWASQNLLSLVSPLTVNHRVCHCRIWKAHWAPWANWDYHDCNVGGLILNNSALNLKGRAQAYLCDLIW